jgi:hypothetical protein
MGLRYSQGDWTSHAGISSLFQCTAKENEAGALGLVCALVFLVMIKENSKERYREIVQKHLQARTGDK